MKKGLRWENGRMYIGSSVVGEVATEGFFNRGVAYIQPSGRWICAEHWRPSYPAAQRDAEELLVRSLHDYYLGARQLLEAIGAEVPDAI